MGWVNDVLRAPAFYVAAGLLGGFLMAILVHYIYHLVKGKQRRDLKRPSIDEV